MKSNINNMNKKTNFGFTLIELIVTVSIVAILASIAAPSFRTMIKNNRATVAANELVSALLLARSEALKRKNNITICISDDQNQCKSGTPTNFAEGWLVFVDCNKNHTVSKTVDLTACSGASAETIIKAQLGSKGMEVKRTTGDPNFFTYNLTGRTDAATTFKVTETGSSTVLKTITVSLTGRVKTQ